MLFWVLILFLVLILVCDFVFERVRLQPRRKCRKLNGGFSRRCTAQ